MITRISNLAVIGACLILLSCKRSGSISGNTSKIPVSIDQPAQQNAAQPTDSSAALKALWDIWNSDRDLIFSQPLPDEAKSDLKNIWESLRWTSGSGPGLSAEQHAIARQILGKYLTRGGPFERMTIGWAIYKRTEGEPDVGIRRGGGATLVEEDATLGVARHLIALGMCRFEEDFRPHDKDLDHTNDLCRKNLTGRLDKSK